MLELIVGVFRSLFRFDSWLSGGHLLDTLRDERRQREHDRQWARGFPAEKRLEREQQALRLEAQVSRFVNRPLELGRLGSRRTP